MTATPSDDKYWFVMRDLKRFNAKLPAFRQLGEAGFRVFTPMTSKLIVAAGRRTRIEVPFVQDLLFVYSDRASLDGVVERTDTLQYRFVKGAPYGTPMTVPVAEMERFIDAVSRVKTPLYYRPDELTSSMYGARVRMICEGSINGLEGILLKVKGSGKKRLLINLPGILAASIEVSTADYVEILD